MTDPYHAMLAEMAAELDWSQQLRMDNRTATHPLADRARVLIAQPEPPDLTDEELDDIIIDVALPGLDRESAVRLASIYERSLMRAAIAADRARNPTPQPPADGDVGECLRIRAASLSAKGASLSQRGDVVIYFTCAADLLQRFVSPICYVISPSPEALASLKAAGPGEFIPFCEEGK